MIKKRVEEIFCSLLARVRIDFENFESEFILNVDQVDIEWRFHAII